ncbi:MAG: hypothetical protein JOY82_04185 [Streptosporangiaceae bacterium]|nr:hypothetical protein [Streptosporangiaceae bacterium]MBV9853711.1 hypothetical protein [Streptosporangiaceae bacterium]
MLRDQGRSPEPRGAGFIQRVIPATSGYHGQRFWVRRAGRVVATPLLVVLVLIEISDLIFAVDSIPAVFSVTTEPFLVFTSNAFAILGLRALYFLLDGLLHRFTYLRQALAVVLAFVGLKMLLSEVIHVPVAVSLGFIAACLGIAALAGPRESRRDGDGAGHHERPPAERQDRGDGEERWHSRTAGCAPQYPDRRQRTAEVDGQEQRGRHRHQLRGRHDARREQHDDPDPGHRDQQEKPPLRGSA